jgi:hypothetical protein
VGRVAVARRYAAHFAPSTTAGSDRRHVGRSVPVQLKSVLWMSIHGRTQTETRGVKVNRKIAAAAALAVLVAMFASGCGSSSTSSKTALTKTEFVAKANAICKKGNAALAKAAKTQFGGAQPGTSQVAAFGTKTDIPNIEGQITAIEALGAPSGDEAQVKAILDAVHQGLTTVKDDPTLFAQQGNTAFAKANGLSKAYGLDQCAA